MYANLIGSPGQRDSFIRADILALFQIESDSFQLGACNMAQEIGVLPEIFHNVGSNLVYTDEAANP